MTNETLIDALRRHLRESGRPVDEIERDIKSTAGILGRFVRGESGISIDLADRLVEVLHLKLVRRDDREALADRLGSLERRVAELEGGRRGKPPVAPPPPTSTPPPPPGPRKSKPAVEATYSEEQAARAKSLLRSSWSVQAIAADTGVSEGVIEGWKSYWEQQGELS